MIYNAYFHITMLIDPDWKRFLTVLTAIAVIAAVTATVLLVVGSVLSTQNG